MMGLPAELGLRMVLVIWGLIWTERLQWAMRVQYPFQLRVENSPAGLGVPEIQVGEFLLPLRSFSKLEK